jgi:hypothetical protein
VCRGTQRFLAHAAQVVGGKPISTRRVAMCSGYLIEELAAVLLACVSIASAFATRGRSSWPTPADQIRPAIARPDAFEPGCASSEPPLSDHL